MNFILHRSHGKHFSEGMAGCCEHSHDLLHQNSLCGTHFIFRNLFLLASYFPGSNAPQWKLPRIDEELESKHLAQADKPLCLSSFVGYTAVTKSRI